MADIVARLREAHPNSAQRFAGSNILLDAADEIERLRKALEKIDVGYGPNHLSKYARDVARAALTEAKEGGEDGNT